MKLSYAHLIVVLCATGSAFGQLPFVVRGSGDESATISVDGAGNVYVAGEFEDEIDLGGGPLTSPGSDAIFMAKFDADGNHLWSRALGGSTSSGFRSLLMTVDGAGNIILTRDFTGTLNLGGDDLASPASRNLFIAKYSTNGTHLWSRQYGGRGSEIPEAVFVDPEGCTHITGFFGDIGNFGGTDFTAQDTDLFLAKYDGDGDHIWSFGAGGPADEHPFALSVDDPGNVFVTGFFGEGSGQAETNLGGDAILSRGSSDIFLAKYSVDGRHIWSEGIGGAAAPTQMGFTLTAEIAFDIAQDAQELYVAGVFQDSTDLGGGVIVSRGGNDSDLFVTNYDTSGSFQWAQGVGGTADDTGGNLVVASNGNIFLAGAFREMIEFGNVSFQSLGETDAFISAFTPDGANLWAKRIGGSGSDFGGQVAYRTNEIYIGVNFTNDIEVDGQLLTGIGGRDLMVAKLSADGQLITTIDEAPEQPGTFLLRQNYPNPFNPETTIVFELSEQSEVRIEIFNGIGQMVRTLLRGREKAGEHRVVWDGRADDGTALATGAYFYKISVNRFVQTKAMLLLR